MRRLVALAVAAAALFGTTAAFADSLASRVKSADGWVSWDVPMIAGAGDPCCWSGHGDHAEGRIGCDLDGRNHGFSTNDQPKPPSTGTLTVYAHVAHARMDDVRAFEASCPVHAASAIRHVDGVVPTESIAMLAEWMDSADAKRDDDALPAIAYHADAAATRLLASRADPSHERKQREDALFWLGQARGTDGAAIVERYATTDGDPKLREHAIFALSQSNVGDPYERIHAIAGSDPSDHVRSQALFWMAQMGDRRAAKDITAAIEHDASSSVREQGVFALSQIEGGAGEDALISLLKGNYPRDVKKQALFWLGQSGSPRAMQYFDEALTKSR
nr:HEAT repeat domain-containing protein [Rhodanobacteraceae bacterium]